MPASKAIYMLATARPRISGRARSTVQAVMVGPFIPQLKPKMAEPVISIHWLCENERITMATTSVNEELISTGMRPYLSDDLPATIRAISDVAV